MHPFVRALLIVSIIGVAASMVVLAVQGASIGSFVLSGIALLGALGALIYGQRAR
jgi:hypothetical protein